MQLNCLVILFLSSVALINSKDFKHSKIHFGVDNLINKVKLNENEVQVKKIDLSNTDSFKTIDLVLFPGDELAFSVSKEFNLLKQQPGFAATIDYVDQKGNEQRFNTGSGWICGGAEAQLFDQIGATTKSSWKVWKNTDISESAYVIWANSKPNETVCKFVIPKP